MEFVGLKQYGSDVKSIFSFLFDSLKVKFCMAT
jgi:hypothetical protein